LPRRGERRLARAHSDRHDRKPKKTNRYERLSTADCGLWTVLAPPCIVSTPSPVSASGVRTMARTLIPAHNSGFSHARHKPVQGGSHRLKPNKGKRYKCPPLEPNTQCSNTPFFGHLITPSAAPVSHRFAAVRGRSCRFASQVAYRFRCPTCRMCSRD
jgi:hypothetical protein